LGFGSISFNLFLSSLLSFLGIFYGLFFGNSSSFGSSSEGILRISIFLVLSLNLEWLSFSFLAVLLNLSFFLSFLSGSIDLVSNSLLGIFSILISDLSGSSLWINTFDFFLIIIFSFRFLL